MTHPHHILAFDPSTTRTGWARIDRAGTVIDLGAIVLTSHDAGKRAAVLFDAVRQIANDERTIPGTDFAVEWPSQHSHRRVKGSGGAGLAVYGTAPGVVYGALRSLVADNRIRRYEPNDWSRGSTKRVEWYRRVHPMYEKVPDAKGDIADAIGIAEHAWREIDLERSIA